VAQASTATSARGTNLGVTEQHVASAAKQPRVSQVSTADAPVLSAYSRGDYVATATAARTVIHAVAAEPKPSLPERKAAVRARHLLAFAAARQKDLATARAQFAVLRTEAAKLPDHGKPDSPAPIGEMPPPTLEEDAAYQHAVCTAALGDKGGAEKEYIAFMHSYPDSPLVQAAIKRIARLHGGDIPKEAEGAWHQAMQVASAHERQRQRNASLCGPECLSELLRRQKADPTLTPSTLANEMKTSENGTSLAALAESAKHHGFVQARGLALSQKGLAEQKLPLVALVDQGHFVIVDNITPHEVRVWDPDAEGVGKGAARTYPLSHWQRIWREGIALALQ